MSQLEALKALGKVYDYILSQDDNKYSKVQKEETIRLIEELFSKINSIIE